MVDYVYIFTDWLEWYDIELIGCNSRVSDFTEGVDKVREIKTSHGRVRDLELHISSLAGYECAHSFPKPITQRSILTGSEERGDCIFLDSFNEFQGFQADPMSALDWKTIDPFKSH